MICPLYDRMKGMRTVTATRYVTPLREGGSMPAIVEADDLGLYVLKFRGAGQGPLALVAELVAGEIGRALGLKVPELVTMEVDAALGRNEADSEIRELLKASVGINLALDYLPGSATFDPAAADATPETIDPDLASAVVWFDALVTNVDRTARNPNLLWWHKVLYLIDHGAALYFHHNWGTPEQRATAAASPFPAVRDHVLLPWASRLEAADARLAPLLGESVFARIVAEIPDGWLVSESESESGKSAADERRTGYVDYLTRRLAASPRFVAAAIAAATARGQV
jgi:hypothetical protein